ncbi:rhodopsin [Procambarus clarkii]|uniref:Rhodopsin n=1 Tax=Procambarus clarkii TaxID=6728 RepID=A0A0P0EL09_PROCL|nr:rhodopsin [Procambarus clarkii]ALJ26467.1 long wavelength-sensitive opsin [Procambarus clarkii]
MSSWSNQPAMDDYGLPSSNPYGNFTVVDMAPKDILHMIHPHWYQYPPMNPMMYPLLLIFMLFTGILCLAGNFVTIWVFMNTKSLRTPANLLVVNLAMSDFLMMFTMFPPMMVTCYYHTWTLGPTFCQVYAFLGNLCGCASIWTMVFITFDRYNVIVKGVAGEPLSTKKASLWILTIWVLSITWCIAPFFGWNRYVPEGNLTGCGTDYLSEDILSRSYLYVYSTWVYFLPLAITIYCYVFIIKAVAAHEKGMRDQAKKMGIKSLRNEEAQKTSAECRLAKIAMTTVALWFIAWTPYLLINWVGMFARSYLSPVYTIWGYVFAKANAVYNPIVYAISHPKYRAAMEKKLPCLSCKTESDDVSESASTTTSSAEEKAESA